MVQMYQLGALSLDKNEHRPLPRVKQDKPAWMVGGKGFFDQNAKFWRPGECMYYAEVPNIDLIPLNKMAYDNQQLWLDMIDELAERKAKAEKKSFVKTPRREWCEPSDMVDVPTPDSIFAPAAKGQNEAIR